MFESTSNLVSFFPSFGDLKVLCNVILGSAFVISDFEKLFPTHWTPGFEQSEEI